MSNHEVVIAPPIPLSSVTDNVDYQYNERKTKQKIGHHQEDSLDHMDPEMKQLSRKLLKEAIEELNPNSYATVKTVSQGILDIAILTTHLAFLKRLITAEDPHTYYTELIVLIGISLFLQVAAAVLLTLMAVTNLNTEIERVVEKASDGTWEDGKCPVWCCVWGSHGCTCVRSTSSLNFLNVVVMVMLVLIALLNVVIVVMIE